MKLKIIHKGLLILLLPFAIETALFGFLFVLNEGAEQSAQQARYRYKFIQRINVMMEDSGIAWGSIINRLVTANNVNHFRQISPVEYRSTTDKQIKELKEIPLVSENRTKILSIIEQMCKLQADMLDLLEDNRESFGSVGSVPIIMRQVKDLHYSFYLSRIQFLEVKKLLDLEQTKLDDAIKRDADRRDLTKTLLIAGFVGQLLLTVGLLLLLLKNITNRLTKLVQNAHILPTLNPLQEHVSGNDEIAYMDKVLHDASESLISAAQNRQSINHEHDCTRHQVTTDVLKHSRGQTQTRFRA